ncbi:hypothetical protein TBR22_A11030 [Luteitalea sp. TBR-22]|uniref:hypothetical protein n=1 Tax=Luteitalea sp. TBR-22 TaxID=2802971 RepID=UPI001AF6ABF0|nr:hypothetical protein [Luteitalea sp. TBR-22]BCS31900.1 hypothetical protein TBR22_A11030 [Luteitalea sp. TBR-22]
MFRQARSLLLCTATLLVAVPAMAQMTPGAEPGDVLSLGQVMVEAGAGMTFDAEDGTSGAGAQPLIRFGIAPGIELLGGSGGWTSACFGRCAWSPTTAFAGWRALIPGQMAGFNTAVSGLFYYPTRTDHAQPRVIESSFMLHVDRAIGEALLLTFNAEIARLHDAETAVLRHGEGFGLVWDRGGRWLPLVRFGHRAAAVEGPEPWYLEMGTGLRMGGAFEYEFAVTRGLNAAEPGWGVAAAVAISHDFRPLY